MNDWVKGPIPLNERTLDVYEGTACVILRNGEVYAVRGAGRHGGLLRLLDEERRLPVSGSLSVLTFESAPALSNAVATDVRLRDGSTVTVTMRAAIVPLWEKDPEALKGVVRRYGVQPTRIQAAAQLELDESLRVMAVESLGPLTHAQVHDTPDPRTLMRLPRPTGLLTVGRLVACSISRDRHEEASLTEARDGSLAELHEAISSRLAQIRAAHQNEVDSIRRRGELTGRQESALSEAEVNTIVAKLLGVPTIDIAYPAQRGTRLQAQFATARAVLENNMDLIPLLSDPAFGSGASGFRDLMGSLFAEPDRGNHPHPPVATPPSAVAGQPAMPRNNRRILRSATALGPSGTFEIQIVQGSSDQVVGAIGTDRQPLLMISATPDAVDVALRALNAAAIWCGVGIGARVLNRGTSGSPGRVAMTRVVPGERPPHQDVERALGAWIAAINRLLAGEAEIHIDA